MSWYWFDSRIISWARLITRPSMPCSDDLRGNCSILSMCGGRMQGNGLVMFSWISMNKATLSACLIEPLNPDGSSKLKSTGLQPILAILHQRVKKHVLAAKSCLLHGNQSSYYSKALWKPTSFTGVLWSADKNLDLFIRQIQFNGTQNQTVGSVVLWPWQVYVLHFFFVLLSWSGSWKISQQTEICLTENAK